MAPIPSPDPDPRLAQRIYATPVAAASPIFPIIPPPLITVAKSAKELTTIGILASADQNPEVDWDAFLRKNSPTEIIAIMYKTIIDNSITFIMISS
jgi:hypothetical protein